MMVRNIAVVLVLGILALLGLRSLGGTRTAAEDPSATTEVQSVVLDYSLAMQTGDERMLDRVLHPRAAKLGFSCSPPGRAFAFRAADRRDLLAARHGIGGEAYRPREDTDEIEVLGLTALTASARLTGTWGTEFLHLARDGSRWRIVGVLGMEREPAGAPPGS